MRLLAAVIAMLLCIGATGCAAPQQSSDIVSGSGQIYFSSSSTVQEHPAPESPPAVTPSDEEQQASRPRLDEVRSVWISYLELEHMLTDKTETQYRATIAEVMQTCADFGLNTVVLQVRPFGDAIYPSGYFPCSYLFTGEEQGIGENPFDALQIAIDEASSRGLRLEAWINPYRVRRTAERALSEDNPANEMLANGDVERTGELITYNPAGKLAQSLIVNGVIELVENYDIDAIHFDDYFYPTTDAAFDAVEYSSYKQLGGALELADWRRSNVTELVRRVHDAIKERKPWVRFGISPQGNQSNNYNSQYVDVEEIIKSGLVDYVCPQIYFGFNNAACPFKATAEAFNSMARGTDVEIYVGLATYKFNKEDSWAGDGRYEWIGSTDLLRRQVETARELSRYGGFVLFRYDSSFDGDAFYPNDGTARSQLAAEMQSLCSILK